MAIQGKANFAWVDSLDVEFDPVLHARLDLQIQSFALSHTEGEYARLSVTCLNPGIGLLAPGRPQYGLLSVELDGNPPELIFRGIVNSMPTNLSQDGLVTLEFFAQPDDQDEKLEAYAKTISDRPYVEPLISGRSYRDPSTALLARSATYYIDPITHEYSLNDYLDWDNLVDIGPEHQRDRFAIAMQAPPLGSVTLTGIAEWTQVAKGVVDIREQVNNASGRDGIWSLTNLNELASSFEILDKNGSSGWSVAHVEQTGDVGYTASKFKNGNFERVLLQKQIGVTTGGAPIFRNWIDTRYQVQPLQEYHFRASKYMMSYNYSQPRREVLSVKLDADIQDIDMFGYTEEDLDDINLDSLVSDPSEPWMEKTDYVVGDRVAKQDQSFVCQEDHNSGYDPFQRVLPQYASVPTYLRTKGMYRWKEVPREVALKDGRSGAFFTTPRGREVAAHLVLRARAMLRKRLRCLEVTINGRWEELGRVTLKDGLRVVHDYFQTDNNEAFGKIISYTKNWNGLNQSYDVDVTIGISAASGYSILPGIDNGEGYSAAFSSYSFADGAALTDQVEDVQFTLSGDPVRSTCNPYKLNDPTYACVSVNLSMTESEQLVIARRAEALGRSAIKAAADNPTKFEITMRGIDGLDIITRQLTVTSNSVQGPKGIDLKWGG